MFCKLPWEVVLDFGGAIVKRGLCCLLPWSLDVPAASQVQPRGGSAGQVYVRRC